MANPITIVRDSAGIIRGLYIDGLNGEADWPIVIDGHNRLIDGEGQFHTLWVRNSSHVVIRRLNLCNSKSRESMSDNSEHIRFEEILSWEAADGNCMPWTVTRSHHVTLADCAGWGRGRKIFQLYKSDDCALIRCWGRWGYMTTPDPGSCGVYAPAYNSFRAEVRNCIGTVTSDTQQLVNAVFLADHMDGSNAGMPADCHVDHCLAMSSMPKDAFHSGTPTGSITYSHCIDATQTHVEASDWRLLWMLREQWKASPILERLRIFAQADPLHDIDDVINACIPD